MFLNKKLLLQIQLNQKVCFGQMLMQIFSAVLVATALKSCSTSTQVRLIKTQEITLAKVRSKAAFNTLNDDSLVSTKGVAITKGLANVFAQTEYIFADNAMHKIAHADVIAKGTVQMGLYPTVSFLSNSESLVVLRGVDSSWYESRKASRPNLDTFPWLITSKSSGWLKKIRGSWKIIQVKVIEGQNVY